MNTTRVQSAKLSGHKDLFYSHRTVSTTNQNSQHKINVSKLKPQKIEFQKERLKMDIEHLQDDIVGLRDENAQLQNVILRLQKDKDGYESVIERVEDFIMSKSQRDPIRKESNLVIGFKQQLQTLRNQIKQKQEKLKTLSKDAKVMDHVEKELESSLLKEHLNKLTQSTKQQNQQQQIQSDEVKKQKNDNLQLIRQIRNLDQQTQEQQKENMKQEKMLQEQTDDIQAQQEEYENRREEVEQLQQFYRRKQGELVVMENKLKESKQKKPESAYDLEQLRQTLLQKDDVIQAQQKQLQELSRKIESFNRNETEQTSKLQETLKEDNQQAWVMEREIEQALYLGISHEVNIRQFLDTTRYEQFMQMPDYVPILNSQLKTPFLENQVEVTKDIFNKTVVKKFKKVPKVQYHEIQRLGVELSMRLKVKRLTMEDIYNVLRERGEESRRKRVSIREMAHFLLQEPFQLRDMNSALQLARYLVEDNYNSHVELNYGRTINLSILKSVIRKLLNNYKLSSEEELKEIQCQVDWTVNKYRVSLENTFTKDKQVGEYLTEEQFKEGFIYIDVSNKLIDSMVQQMFSFSNDIDRLEYRMLFKIYEHKRVADMQVDRQLVKRQNAYILTNYDPQNDLEVDNLINDDDRALYRNYQSDNDSSMESINLLPIPNNSQLQFNQVIDLKESMAKIS